jgi:hypothetical protein
METNYWDQLPVEKRAKALSLITEFSTIAVSWNDKAQENIMNIFSKWVEACQEEYDLKPHELIVISKMLQEFALTDLFEWLPSDFEEWEEKDELMTMFFFGKEGLESYREEKKKFIKS